VGCTIKLCDHCHGRDYDDLDEESVELPTTCFLALVVAALSRMNRNLAVPNASFRSTLKCDGGRRGRCVARSMFREWGNVKSFIELVLILRMPPFARLRLGYEFCSPYCNSIGE